MSYQNEHIQEPSVIISASFHRSGSTWLQRMITEATDIFVWGEGHGLTEQFAKHYNKLRANDLNHEKERAILKNQIAKLTTSFVANLMPELQKLEFVIRQFYSSYYQLPSAVHSQLDCKHYGFKEVRFGNTEIQFLLHIFKNTKIILLVRNIYDVIRSIKGRRWLKEYNPEGFFTLPEVCVLWAQRSSEYFKIKNSNCYLLKYEDCQAQFNDVLHFLNKNSNFKNDNMLNTKYGSSSEKPNTEITDEEYEKIDYFAGEAIDLLGYERKSIVTSI